MAGTKKVRPDLALVPMLPHEMLYIGVDVGKFRHVAGFLSRTLLQRHERFEGCPAFAFEQSREGFCALVDRIREYVPLEQATVLIEHTGHYHKNLEQYLLELDITVYRIHVQERPKGMMGLTGFLGGCKLGKRHPTGGYHAKRTAHLYEGIQSGGRAPGANIWEIPVASRP